MIEVHDDVIDAEFRQTGKIFCSYVPVSAAGIRPSLPPFAGKTGEIIHLTAAFPVDIKSPHRMGAKDTRIEIRTCVCKEKY